MGQAIEVVKTQIMPKRGDVVARKRTRGRRGEGTVWQEKDGSWRGEISLGVRADGKRIRKRTARHDNEDAAWAELDEIIRKWNAGELPDDTSKITVEQYLTTWLGSIQRSVRRTTYDQYESVCRLHIFPRIGQRQLAKLNSLHLTGMQSDMIRDGLSDRRREIAHTVLRRALQQAVRMKLIRSNPCDEIERPRSESARMTVLSAEQTRALLETARGTRYYALYVLAVMVGMRQGELFGLMWSDIDLSARTLSVNRSLQELRGVHELVPPKTKRGRRSIDLPKRAVAALRLHRWKLARKGQLREFVFTDSRGGFIRKSNFLRRNFQPLLEQAGLPNIRFHDLRHTCATLHLSAGTPAKVVQEMLGHANIGVTMDTYSHVVPGMGRDAADKMDILLSS